MLGNGAFPTKRSSLRGKRLPKTQLFLPPSPQLRDPQACSTSPRRVRTCARKYGLPQRARLLQPRRLGLQEIFDFPESTGAPSSASATSFAKARRLREQRGAFQRRPGRAPLPAALPEEPPSAAAPGRGPLKSARGFVERGLPVQMNTIIKYAREASLWKWEIKVAGSQERRQKARLRLLPQLLCTRCSVLLTSHISIRLQHILPSPARNQNLEGSDLPAKPAFDTLVTDARQLRFGGELLQNAIANLWRHPRKLRDLLGTVWEGKGGEGKGAGRCFVCCSTRRAERSALPPSHGAERPQSDLKKK